MNEVNFDVFLGDFAKFFQGHQDAIILVENGEYAVQQLFSQMKKAGLLIKRPRVFDVASMLHLTGLDPPDLSELSVLQRATCILEEYKNVKQKVATMGVIDTLFGGKK